MKKQATNKIKKMESFLDWFHNRVKSIHVLSNEQFVNILNKI